MAERGEEGMGGVDGAGRQGAETGLEMAAPSAENRAAAAAATRGEAGANDSVAKAARVVAAPTPSYAPPLKPIDEEFKNIKEFFELETHMKSNSQWFHTDLDVDPAKDERGVLSYSLQESYDKLQGYKPFLNDASSKEKEDKRPIAGVKAEIDGDLEKLQELQKATSGIFGLLGMFDRMGDLLKVWSQGKSLSMAISAVEEQQKSAHRIVETIKVAEKFSGLLGALPEAADDDAWRRYDNWVSGSQAAYKAHVDKTSPKENAWPEDVENRKIEKMTHAELRDGIKRHFSIYVQGLNEAKSSNSAIGTSDDTNFKSTINLMYDLHYRVAEKMIKKLKSRGEDISDITIPRPWSFPNRGDSPEEYLTPLKSGDP